MRSDRFLHTLTVGLLIFVLIGGSFPVDAGHKPSAKWCPQTNETLANENHASYWDFNLISTDIAIRSGGTLSTGDEFGAYHVFESTGTLVVDFSVANNGTNDPITGVHPPLLVRVTLTGPDGGTVVRDTWFSPAPDQEKSVSGGVELPIADEGAQTVTVVANPVNGTESTDSGRDFDEVCHDSQDEYELYGVEYGEPNDASFALLVGDLPDLRITDIQVHDRIIASRTSGDDTTTRVSATVHNAGTTAAFAHTATEPGTDPIMIGFAIEGATCHGSDTGLVEVDSVPPGGEATVSTTCNLEGIAKDSVLTVSADHDDVVFESLEGNNKNTAVVPVSAPDIVVDFDTGLSASEGVFLLPEGQDLDLTYTIENDGDAPTAPDGSDFTTKVTLEDEVINETTLWLGSFESATVQMTVDQGDLEARKDPYTIRFLPDMASKSDDTGGEVLESDEDNLVSFKVLVASFDVALNATENETTIPPGVAGKLPLTVTNAGTVADSLALEIPDDADGRVRYTDAGGSTLSTLHLDPDESVEVFFEYQMPNGSVKDDRTTLQAAVASTTSGADARATAAITFITGEDDVAPTVKLHDPESGYLRGDKVTIQVTDNVEVAKVESNLGGTYETLVASDADPAHYVLDVTGHPGAFEFQVRAVDVNGNQATETLEVVRDDAPPRIASYSFDPESGAVPGQKVRITVDARDDNMEGVHMTIRQAPDYEVRLDAEPGGSGYVAQWTVPSKPGRFIVEMVAEDKAGNKVVIKDQTYERYDELIPYFAAGYDIEILNPTRPQVTPSAPQEGQTVRFTYQIRNSNEQFGMDRFEVRFAVDRTTFVDRTFIELGPGETKSVTMSWVAEPGPHVFNIIVDRTDVVPESDETNNAPITNTQTVFRGQSLFAAEEVRDPGFLTFLQRMEKFWYLPVLLAANVVLFVIAAVLGRRPTT